MGKRKGFMLKSPTLTSSSCQLHTPLQVYLKLVLVPQLAFSTPVSRVLYAAGENQMTSGIDNYTRLMPPTAVGPPWLTRDPESSISALLLCYSAEEFHYLKVSGNFLPPYLHTYLHVHLYLNPFFLIQKNVLSSSLEEEKCFLKISLLKN